MKTIQFLKIPVELKLPEEGKWVTTIDEAGEHRVYRLTEYGWNMRDADGVNSPNKNLKITHWLEEVEIFDPRYYLKNIVEKNGIKFPHKKR